MEAIYGEEKLVEGAPQESIAGDEPIVDEPQYSEEEQQAMAKGWKPEGVEGKPKISAGEFLRNESFFDKIANQNKTINSLESQLNEVIKQHTKIAEIEREKALNELKQAKKEAYENEDFDKVVEIDDKIAEAKSIDTSAETKTGTYIDPAFAPWQAQNPWYDQEKDPALFVEATMYAQQVAQTLGVEGVPLYEAVKSEMAARHPEKFGMSSKKTATVEGAARGPRPRAGEKRKFTRKDLNETQRRVCDRYVKSGVMTEEEYITDLAAIGELG